MVPRDIPEAIVGNSHTCHWSLTIHPEVNYETAKREQKWYVIEPFLTKFVKWSKIAT